MKSKGKITDWNDKKGFGFITPIGGGSAVFVHISAFPRGRRPALNNQVTYVTAPDKQNRLCAHKVMLLGAARYSSVLSRGFPLAFAAVAAFFAGLIALYHNDVLPLLAVVGYVSVSTALLAMYGWDKSKAKSGGQRTAEATLHLFALAGGWPGALLAQHLFKHKTRKQPFQTIFWCVVTIHCVGLAWWAYSGGVEHWG